MSEARFAAIHAGMTEAAKKVYAAIPISETWHVTKIVTELARTGSRMDYNVVIGCLTSLVHAKLVRESSGRDFRREPIRPAPTAKPDEKPEEPVKSTPPVAPPPAAPAVTEKTAIEKFNDLGARISSMSEMLTEMGSVLKDLHVEFNAAAAEARRDVEANHMAVRQLADLKAMFKTLGIAG